MKKQVTIISILAFCILIFLTACSNQIDESTIKQDIEPIVSKILANDVKIDDIEILEYNNEKETETFISLKVTSSNDVAEYVDYYRAKYSLSDDNKWIFDKASQVDKDKSTASPKKGITEGEIISSLDGEYVEINGEEWEIDSNNIKNLTIENQKTNIEERKDKVTVTLILDDAVEEANGNITINYIFDKAWKVKSLTETGKFKITEKSECNLEISEADLIKEIANNKLVLFKETSNSQAISMSKSEISDFEVYKTTSDNRGTDKRYYCKGKLSKPTAIINFNAVIYYIYENDWLLQPTTISAKLDSIDINGKWSGTYNGAGDDGKSILEINDVKKDGKIKGFYKFTPDIIDEYTPAGSYKVSGTIDYNSLIIELTEDNADNVFTDINAVLDIEKSTIEGIGQEGYPIELKKAR